MILKNKVLEFYKTKEYYWRDISYLETAFDIKIETAAKHGQKSVFISCETYKDVFLEVVDRYSKCGFGVEIRRNLIENTILGVTISWAE